MTNCSIRVEGLKKSYKTKNVLNGVEFSAHKGEIIGVIGKNGAGKSTFLEILMGIKEFDDGVVDVLGYSLKEISKDQLKKIKNRISVVLQPTQFYKKLKVKELLDLFNSYYKEKMDLNQVIEKFELQEHLETFFDNLSGGWKQKVSLAIAFSSKPELIILDEPTTGLDPHMRNTLWENIMAYVKETSSTVILSTHYMDEVELYCDKVFFINNGVGEVFDTPENILTSGYQSINSFYLDRVEK